jgi:hypothetical protein
MDDFSERLKKNPHAELSDSEAEWIVRSKIISLVSQVLISISFSIACILKVF